MRSGRKEEVAASLADARDLLSRNPVASSQGWLEIRIKGPWPETGSLDPAMGPDM